MNVFPRGVFPRILLAIAAAGMAVALTEQLSGQSAATLTVLSKDPRRAIPIATANGQDLVALDDLASAFQLAVREDSGAITVSYKGRTIVLTPDQTIASVAGRVISLPAPPSRTNNRWYVPIDFISRALAPIYDARLDLRRPSRLLIVGDLRVPRLAVQQEPVGGNARITIDAAPRANATVVQESSRLLARFDADALDAALPGSPLAGFVQGYRIEGTTIAIELGPRVSTFRSSVQGADSTARLVIDLLSAAGDPPMPPSSQAEPVAPPELPALTGSVRTVAIDPGHGGDDQGARGAGGTTEKTVALAVARRLKTGIETRLGFRVVMTRDDDRAVAISDRTALANNNKADLFISIHANASYRPALAGATIYTAAFDAGAEASAPRSSVGGERLPAIGGGIRDIELVPWNLAQMRYQDQSDALAAAVAGQLQNRVPLAPRPIERAALRVLESANMPAVLVETGYLSNAEQEKLLASADFQSTLAQSIVDAIVQFRSRAAEGAAR